MNDEVRVQCGNLACKGVFRIDRALFEQSAQGGTSRMAHARCPDCDEESVFEVADILPDVVTPSCDPDHVHRIWRAPWYPVAEAVAATGHDCTVLDPGADHDEAFYDGNPNHGVIQVRTHVGLGWTVIVSECEPDVEDDE